MCFKEFCAMNVDIRLQICHKRISYRKKLVKSRGSRYLAWGVVEGGGVGPVLKHLWLKFQLVTCRKYNSPITSTLPQ